MTGKEFQELSDRINSIAGTSVAQPAKPRQRVRPEPVSGPLNISMVLWGHCPSKKNLWRVGSNGQMFLDAEVKAQIDTLTTQAMFKWNQSGPVVHPELAITFVVAAERQDQDGMYTTILDCLQAAGVLVNDNIKHNNGRKILEPCQIFKDADERVEIWIRKEI